VCTTDSKHCLPVAANLLEQNFVADQPNQVWLADITYIPTSEGWLYLAVILDLFTRKVVGWAMRDHMRAELTIAALTMAIQRQRPGAGLIHHSDRGSQGGINWPSQHNREECCDGRETAVGSSVTGQVEVARAAGDGAT
jgi:transposase InsO family protein